MKALVTAVGSAGDVNPFVAIGRALEERGHRAVLLVNPHYERRVRDSGLDFLPLGDQAHLRQLRDTPELWHPRKGRRHLWRGLILHNVPLVVEALEAVIRRDPPDVVVCHAVSFGVRWVCERHGIPCAVAALSPLLWMSHKDGSIHARVFRAAPPQWLLRLYMRLARPYLRRVVDRDLNALRQRQGFPPGRDLFFDHQLGCDLNLGMWSPHFRPPMSDDPPNGRLCGFAWFDRGHEVKGAGDQVERFLNAGEPPIVFTLGSVAPTAAGDFYRHAADACRLLGRRGLLLVGERRNVPASLPAGVCAVDYAPFSAVLPRGCATVHHGGVGTTAQALRAGKPTVVIPVAFDQFDNAERVKRLGVSLTLKRSKASAQTLAAALRRVLDDAMVAERARRLGAKLTGEDGAAAAAEVIEGLVEQRSDK